MNNNPPKEITREMQKERIEHYIKVLENKKLTVQQININTKLLAFWQGYKF